MKARLIIATFVAVLVGVGAGTAGASIKAGSSHSASATPVHVATWRNCGWTTCTDYMTRWETAANWQRLQGRQDIINSIMNGVCVGAGALGTVAALVAGLGGPIGVALAVAGGLIVSLGCSAVTAKLSSQLRTLRAAAQTGGCYAITYLRYGSNNPLFASGWNVVYGGWCRP